MKKLFYGSSFAVIVFCILKSLLYVDNKKDKIVISSAIIENISINKTTQPIVVDTKVQSSNKVSKVNYLNSGGVRLNSKR